MPEYPGVFVFGRCVFSTVCINHAFADNIKTWQDSPVCLHWCGHIFDLLSVWSVVTGHWSMKLGKEIDELVVTVN